MSGTKQPAILVVIGALILTWNASPPVHETVNGYAVEIRNALGKRLSPILDLFVEASPSGDIAPAGEAWALVATGSLLVAIDSTGRIVSKDAAGGTCELPILTHCGIASPGKDETLDSPEVILGLALVSALKGMPIVFDLVSEINVGNIANPRLILCGGVVVEVGRGDYTNKFRRLAQVWLQCSRLGVEARRIDLRFSAQVIVEPATKTT